MSETKHVNRIMRIACAVMAVTMIISVTSVFADTSSGSGNATPTPISLELEKETKTQSGSLKLTKSFPEEGSTNVPVDTVGIKLYFDGNVTAESVRKINDAKGMFKFTGGKNEDIATDVYFDKKNSDCILVTATKKDKNDKETSLNPKSKYRLTISGDLTSADGKTLGEDYVINFRTVDTSGSTKVYMLLMVLMIGGMIAMNAVSNKRKAKAKAEAENIKAINPYKLAKEKGITVQEANAIVAKEKEKREKRLKAAGIDPASLASPKEEVIKGERVKGPRPVSAGGSTYKTGRKAIAEKKAQANAAKNKRNSKGGKKKK